MKNAGLRKPNPYEYQLLEQLCRVAAYNANEYAQQLFRAYVVEEQPSGDVRFVMPDDIKPAPHRANHSTLISEGRFMENGVRGTFLLFAKAGYLYYLEKVVPDPNSSITSWQPALGTIEFLTGPG